MPDRFQEEQPTQNTQPRGNDKRTGERFQPADIPVPKRKDVFRVLKKVAGKQPGRESS